MRESHDTPAGLRGIEAGVARLAEAERAGVPAGMTDRVFEATRATIAAGARPAPSLRFVGSVREPVRTAWVLRVLTPMRVAAVVAVVGAALAVRLATLSTAPAGLDTGATASLEAEIDSMLASSDFLDDGMGELGQRIDLIFAEVLSVDRAADAGDDEWLEGGAM